MVDSERDRQRRGDPQQACRDERQKRPRIAPLAAEQCNLACPYCIKDRLMDLRPGRPQTRMKLETARHAIDAFLALAERSEQTELGLQFRGGESLVNAAVVFGATRYMRSLWMRGPVAVSMVTNATLVTDAVAREMAALKISAER